MTDNVIQLADRTSRIGPEVELFWTHVEDARQNLTAEDYKVFLWALMGKLYMDRKELGK